MSIRFEIHGEIIHVTSADDANALRAALDKHAAREREEERDACAKLAEGYAQNKLALADRLESGEEPGDEDDRKDAAASGWGARVVAGMIRERGKASKQESQES